MNKKIRSALISVFYKDGLETIIRKLNELDVTIYSTGGTQQFIEKLGVKVIPVEELTTYPSILGGRVKTLHPTLFGGILGKRDDETHLGEMKQYNIPEIDLVIVDLYPFEETVAKVLSPSFGGNRAERRLGTQFEGEAETSVIEKIDVGGPSMIRAAAKNYKDVVVVAAKKEYASLQDLLSKQAGSFSIEQRKKFAAKAFEVVAHYDVAISKYFNPENALYFQESLTHPMPMRYGENPHQPGVFYGELEKIFDQLNGKELSYNNLVDVDAAIQLMNEFEFPPSGGGGGVVFAIIKHTNPCGIAARKSVKESWDAALACDPESAFGGVLICNHVIDEFTAIAVNGIFFEVLIAPDFTSEALSVLKSKKNRILLRQKIKFAAAEQFKSVLNGVLIQQTDGGNYTEWKESGGRDSTPVEKSDLVFANAIAKHLKSNAIALVKNKQLVGKGCGQTSRIDSLRQAVEKAKQFNFDLDGAVMASDAFFPFDDCVKLGHAAGIKAFIQPGGSIRDNDSIEYCKQHKLVLVMTGMRHFKH